MNDDDAERQERRRESRTRYKAAHPDRVRQSRRDNLARRRTRLEAEVKRRADDRRRAREWAAAHPDRARERSRAWSEENPDRRREHQRNYYQRNQEQRRRVAREQNTRRRHDPAQREREREYQAANRESRNAQQRIRRSDPQVRDKDNHEQNERRRRERRRRQLGLPPRRPHRATITERENNASAARAFFSRRRGAGDIRLLRHEQAEIQAAASLASDAFWRASLEARMRADAHKPARIAAVVNELLATERGSRLREEVRMDSVARRLRGAEPYPDAEAEARRRALSALAAHRTAHGSTRKAGTFGGVPPRTRPVRPSRGFPSI
ncbi:MAG: hypothetical protein HIU88_03920 [Acidobacteria bacterium]|nr:hypothetical protein [Acidobacteriota bacterium]